MAAKKKAKDPVIHSFKWKGVNRKGGKVSGESQGESVAEVKAELRKQGVNVTRISKKSKSLFSFGDKIKPMDIAVVSRQIATMLGAGVPLVQCLQLIAKSSEKLPFLAFGFLQPGNERIGIFNGFHKMEVPINPGKNLAHLFHETLCTNNDCCKFVIRP